MPSSPKFFHGQPTYSKRPSSVFFYSFLLISIAGFFVLVGLVFGARTGFKCRSNNLVKSVRVVWERSRPGDGDGDVSGGSLNDVQRRHKVMGFVGIQTGFGSIGRRRSLRKTWMPSDHQGHEKLEEATGLAFRFIIGRTKNESKVKALRAEVAEYDDFILLDIEEEYRNLPYKTLAFFKAAYELYDAEFYVKADDDIYLRPDRLSLLLAKDRSYSQTYIGCMKKGPVFTNPKSKWYESQSYLLGKEYFYHAYGPIYALSADAVASLVALRNNSFRMFSNEDVTIGAWMLAMNVKHENFRTLCSPKCTGTSVAVWDIPKCSGLCNPERQLVELHQMEICSKSPTLAT